MKLLCSHQRVQELASRINREKIVNAKTNGRSGAPKTVARGVAAIGVALAWSTGAAAAPANLLTNGSFEDNPFFIERAEFPRLDDVNGSAPTGWMRDSGTLAEYLSSKPLYRGVTIYNAADGDYFIGPHDGEWWEQTFATVPGQAYQLTYSSANGAVWWSSFYYRPEVSPGTVSVVGSTSLLSAALSGSTPPPTGTTLLDAPFVWTRHSFTFTADAASATLRFGGSAQPDGGYVFIDNASVTAVVPEPSSASLIVLGLLALGLSRRLR